jgi:hypothetical protein
VTIRTVSVGSAYKDGTIAPDRTIHYRTICPNVVLGAVLTAAKPGNYATWGAARLIVSRPGTNELLSTQTFSASQVAGWWGSPELRLANRPEMAWDVGAWEVSAFRARFEYDYTTDTGVTGTATAEITCQYRG